MYESIEPQEYEVLNYKPSSVKQVADFDPSFKKKQLRPGCEHESAIRLLSGEPNLEKAMQKGY